MVYQMQRVVAPALALLTLAEAKAHLRVTHLAEDDLISTLLTAAEDFLDGYEGYLGRALAPQSWRLSLDAWPCSGQIRLPLAPFVAVSEIKYDDLSETEQILSPALYKARQSDGLGLVEPALGATWPPMLRLSILYSVGVEPEADPRRGARLKAALLLMLGDLYDNRAGQVEGKMTFENPAVRRLLEPLRVRSWL